jgi:hypothetical protein
MYNQNLFTSVAISQVVSGSAASTAICKSTGVDMTGYDGVLFLAYMGTGNAATTIIPKSGSGSGSAALTTAVTGNLLTGPGSTSGSAQDAWTVAYSATGTLTTTASEQILALDVKRPVTAADKYIGVWITPGASSTISTVFALRYRGNANPVINNDGSTVCGGVHQVISN